MLLEEINLRSCKKDKVKNKHKHWLKPTQAKEMKCDNERETIKFDLDWEGILKYIREFNKENKYNSLKRG